MSNPKKVGGEYGEIRAPIDIQKLNAYLETHVPVVRTPVDVKQFKFGQVCILCHRSVIRREITGVVKPNIFPHGCKFEEVCSAKETRRTALVLYSPSDRTGIPYAIRFASA